MPPARSVNTSYTCPPLDPNLTRMDTNDTIFYKTIRSHSNLACFKLRILQRAFS